MPGLRRDPVIGVGRSGPLGQAPGARTEGHGHPPDVRVEDRGRTTVARRSGTPGPGQPAHPGGARLAEERQAWVVLATVEGVGERTLARLIATHGSAAAALSLARRGRLGRGLAPAPGGGLAVMPAATLAGIEAAGRDPGSRLAGLSLAGVWTLTLLDPDYPRRLLTLLSPPPVLFGQGRAGALAPARSVAIVGTRRASTAGRLEAARAAATLAARGVTVVSGLAVGIDGAAHAAAVEAGGVTVAAIGSGHTRPGPRAHAPLVRRILERGAVVGELPPAARATRGTYPRRNRLIVALADAALVVEAPERSGALITARLALEHGAPLRAWHGDGDDWRTAGCRLLLDEGLARPYEGIDRLMDDLGWGAEPLPQTAMVGPGDTWSPYGLCDRSTLEAAGTVWPKLGSAEVEVAALIAGGPATMDGLLRTTRAAPGELAAILTLLQLRGLVRTLGPLYLPAGRLLVAPLVGGE